MERLHGHVEVGEAELRQRALVGRQKGLHGIVRAQIRGQRRDGGQKRVWAVPVRQELPDAQRRRGRGQGDAARGEHLDAKAIAPLPARGQAHVVGQLVHLRVELAPLIYRERVLRLDHPHGARHGQRAIARLLHGDAPDGKRAEGSDQPGNDGGHVDGRAVERHQVLARLAALEVQVGHDAPRLHARHAHEAGRDFRRCRAVHGRRGHPGQHNRVPKLKPFHHDRRDHGRLGPQREGNERRRVARERHGGLRLRVADVRRPQGGPAYRQSLQQKAALAAGQDAARRAEQVDARVRQGQARFGVEHAPAQARRRRGRQGGKGQHERPAGSARATRPVPSSTQASRGSARSSRVTHWLVRPSARAGSYVRLKPPRPCARRSASSSGRPRTSKRVGWARSGPAATSRSSQRAQTRIPGRERRRARTAVNAPPVNPFASGQGANTS